MKDARFAVTCISLFMYTPARFASNHLTARHRSVCSAPPRSYYVSYIYRFGEALSTIVLGVARPWRVSARFVEAWTRARGPVVTIHLIQRKQTLFIPILHMRDMLSTRKINTGSLYITVVPLVTTCAICFGIPLRNF